MSMAGSLLSLALALSLVIRADSADDPRAVVRRALRAVEGDSVRAVAAAWEKRLRGDPADRAAVLGLASVARLTYDYPAAERLYDQLLAGDSTAPDRYAAYARLGRAWMFEDRGLSNDAAKAFAHARVVARGARDALAEGEALVGMAFPRARTEGMAVGMAVLDSAARLVPDTVLDLRAELHRRRAVFLGVQADSAAMSEAVLSRDLGRRAGLLRAEALGIRTIGQILGWREESDSAAVVFRQAEELFRRAHDRAWVAVAALDRVNTLLNLGDVGEAREALRTVLSEAEAARSLWGIANAHNGLGMVAMYLNDQVAAAEHLQKAAAMFEAQGDPSSVMKARELLAWSALGAGDFATAKRYTRETMEFYRKTGELPEQFYGMRRMAAIATRERDWSTAERALRDAREFARALERKLGQPLWRNELAYDAGRLAFHRGDMDTAERSFVEYLASFDSTQHVLRYDARAQLAAIHARRGELARAERELTAAADELDRWRATLTDRELRLLAFQTSALELNEPEANVARVLGALAAGGREAAAFEIAERQRARELSDRLTEAAALRARRSTPGPDAAPRGPHSERVTAASVAAALDDRTAILEYEGAPGDTPTTLFVLTRRGVRAHILAPMDSLTEDIGRFVNLTESGADAGLPARSLGAALMDPALGALPVEITHLVVIPDGALYRVPFDALRLADGRYLVERYAVGLAPSSAVFSALRRRPLNEASVVRLLAFGDPAFASEAAPGDPPDAGHYRENEDSYRSAFAAAGGLPRLAGSGREAALVARYADTAVVRRRAAASAAYLKRTPLGAFRVVHLATHALVDDRTVARTALALAPGGGESGFVTPGDLAALELDADLVVLSACRTAGGVVVVGEGVQGLTAPLLQAGARSVVATAWRIGDRRTVAFVDAFYAGLARGLPVDEALRAAKLRALRRGAPAKEWAAFSVVGDPLVRLPMRTPPRRVPWWLVALALVGGGAVAYGVRVRSRHAAERRSVPSAS
jgi:CHAT domain-containing protein/tetratricopeptide (TPR) repeat protein